MAEPGERNRTEQLRQQAARTAAFERFVRGFTQNPQDAYTNRFAGADATARNAQSIDEMLRQQKQFVPRGRELYRVPSDFDLERLPTRAGETFSPQKLTSFVGSSDLQDLGKVLDSEPGYRMSQMTPRQQALLRITAMEDIPGVENVNRIGNAMGAPNSDFKEEGFLGPRTRYQILDYLQGKAGAPSVWNLGAYANMGLGAANILGFLPMLMQGGQAAQGRLNLVPNDPTIGEMR